MGRRARTNCSPIDSAMEKYHNDIGSRLSGVFVPPQPCLDNTANNGTNNNNNGPNSTADALGMFTLDTRSKSHIHHDNVGMNSDLSSGSHTSTTGHVHNDSRRDRDYSPAQCPAVSCLQKSEKSHTLPSTLSQTPSSAMSQKTPESYSCGEDKEKRGLVDKITRALFQRKHTCTRCQRKSRSCLPNKNFNSNEKHYMCGGCRETSHMMKSLVSGQTAPSSNAGTINLTNAGPSEVILNKPRTQLKDSGYETVTSCSTVASAHSHSNGSIKNQIPHDNLSHRDNIGTTCHEDSVSSGQQSSTHDLPVQTSYCASNPTGGLEQYMGVTRDDSPVRILKQVKSRYVENYDGYLPPVPKTQTTQQACSVVKRPALPVFTAPTSTEGVDFASCEPSDNNRAFNTSTQECARTTGCKNTKSKKVNTKVCYTCGATSKPCFRLPWEGGFLCEDCLDGVF